MNTLIFEDEKLNAERLIQLVKRYDYRINILDTIASVAQGVDWLSNNPPPELIFMDIQLSDGSCFEIFNKVNIEIPVIFTTAFDEYALRAFKVNSVDYLLKPIDFSDLKKALDKFRKFAITSNPVTHKNYDDIFNQIINSYKNRFLIKLGDQFKYISTEDIAYFIFIEGIAYIFTKGGSKYYVDMTLDKIESLLDPAHFFRINRKLIISISAIAKIHAYFNGRLKVELIPALEDEVIVSRERVSSFKEWLDR